MINAIVYNPSLYILIITVISLSIKIFYIARYHRYPRSIIFTYKSCAPQDGKV